MNLNLLPDLALFVQIVDQGSFSAVARQTGATPSAISRSVSRLEQEMGCKLLHRTTRKLRLSDAGKTVYEHALEMLDSARLAMDSAGSARAVPQGKLTLSVPKAVGRFVIHPLMLEFLAATRRSTSVCALRIGFSILSMTVSIWRCASPIRPRRGCTVSLCCPSAISSVRRPATWRNMADRERRRICANIAVSALGKRPPIRAGSFAATAKRRLSRPTVVTRQTTPPYALMPSSKIWVSVACRCLPPVRRWRTARLCRFYRNGSLSAAIPASSGYCGRAISTCPPECGQ